MNEIIRRQIDDMRRTESNNVLPLLLMLREASLIVPASIDVNFNAKGKKNAPKSSRINLAMLKNAEGVSVIPAFTDEEQLAKGGAAPSIKMTFEAMCTRLLALNKEAAGIALDPFGNSVFLNRQILEKFWTEKPWEHRSELSRQVIPKGSKIHFMSPENCPEDLINILTEYLETVPEVVAAYMTVIQTEKIKSWLVITESEEGANSDEICKGMLKVSRDHLHDMSLSFLPHDAPMLADVMDKLEAFYARDGFVYYDEETGEISETDDEDDENGEEEVEEVGENGSEE